MFLPVTSSTGALRVAWDARPGSAFRVWVLLRDPVDLTPDDLHPQRLLPYLLRVPVPTAATSATVHVPVGRPLGICVVGRDERDAPQSFIPNKVADIALDVDPPPAAQRPPPDAAVPERPPNAEAPDTAFVLAQGSSHEAMAAMAARMAATGPSPSPAAPGPTGFGLRQQWYLARLEFDAGPPSSPRVVIQRPTFIGPAELAAWAETLPDDAKALPAGCDGLVDATTPEDAMAFFVVLQGPCPWRPIPLAPASPPFERIDAPYVLGDARGRLAAIEARNSAASPAFFDILTAARRGLP